MIWRRRHSMELLAAGIALLGAVLRWASPGRIGIWRDEAQAIAIASMESPGAIFAWLFHHESHPPLYYLLGHAADRAVGNIQGFYGTLSLACSVLAIPIAGYVARRLVSPGAGLLAAAMVACAVPVAFFSVQLRPYAFLAVLWLVSSSALYAAWQRPGSAALLTWGISSAAGIYTSYATLMLLVSQAGVSAWVLSRRCPARQEWSRWLIAIGVMVVALLPATLLLVHQARSASYPPPQPMHLWTPWLRLLNSALTFPFEVVLPIVAGLVSAGYFLKRRGDEDNLYGFMLLPFGAFVAMTLASYRSNLLLPHLLITVAPLGLTAVAVLIATSWKDGKRVRVAILSEAAIATACLGALFSEGIVKTNTDLIAQAIAAEGVDEDLIILVPGAAGASFGRVIDKPMQRIDFPYQRAMAVYPFDDDFSRVSDTLALDATVAMGQRALESGRRVWLVTNARWAASDSATPRVLAEQVFGGLGVADRARAGQIRSELVAMGYRAELRFAAAANARAMELLAAELFVPAQRSDESESGGHLP